jgi:hypothetical protein
MTEEINNRQRQARSSPQSGGFGLVLVLLLAALFVFSFWYPRDDGQSYGDIALLEAQNFKSKVIHKTREAYQCATNRCKSKGADLAANSVAPPDLTKASENLITRPTAQESSAAIVASTSADLPSPAPATTETAKLPDFRALQIIPPGEVSKGAAVAPPPCIDTNKAALEAATPPSLTQAVPQIHQGASFSVPVPFSALELSNTAAIPDRPQNSKNIRPYPVSPNGQDTSGAPHRSQEMQYSVPERIAPTDAPSIQSGKFLLAARESIARHRYQEAIALYRKQLSDNSGDIDAYGELGNLLMFSHYYPEAAQNYYEAATRLLDAGLPEAARPLLPVIERYQPALASWLKQKTAQLDR